MALKPQPVLLGFVDDEIKNVQDNHFTVNKIGGSPDWCQSEGENPVCICTECKKEQSLVMQIYAPLHGSSYHRTLFIFACVSFECRSQPNSWLCLRSQCFVPQAKVKLQTQVPQVAAEVWGMEEGDWSVPDNGNGEFNIGICELPERLIKDANEAIVNDFTRHLEKNLNISEENENGNEYGAVASLPGVSVLMETSEAFIEGAEDGVTLDTPPGTVCDIPALLQHVVKLNVDRVTFIAHFLASDEEPSEDWSLLRHEKQLMAQYAEMAETHLKCESSDSPRVSSTVSGDGFYEKCVAQHGDVFMQKLAKRVARSPTQVLRYNRSLIAEPLWLRRPTDGAIPNKCLHCGAGMTFEMQLMPQLVSFLKAPGVPGSVLEFGTLAIYTCVDSCWGEGDSVRKECVIVQHEIMEGK